MVPLCCLCCLDELVLYCKYEHIHTKVFYTDHCGGFVLKMILGSHSHHYEGGHCRASHQKLLLSTSAGPICIIFCKQQYKSGVAIQQPVVNKCTEKQHNVILIYLYHSIIVVVITVSLSVPFIHSFIHPSILLFCLRSPLIIHTQN